MGSDAAERARELVRERIKDLGLEMKSLSREIGRNPAYIHQYLNKRSPLYIGEQERPILAAKLGISEDLLKPPPKTDMQPKPRFSGFKGVRKPITDQALIEGLISRMLHINQSLKLNWSPERMARAITLGYEAGVEENEANPVEIIDKLVAALKRN